jgi:hypothetical protein
MSLAAVRSTPSAVKGCAGCCCRRNRKAYQATVAIALARDRGQSGLAPRGRCKLFLTQDRCVMQDNRRERAFAPSSSTGVASNNVSLAP